MFSSYIQGYPALAPQTGAELFSSSYDDLKSLELTPEELELVQAVRLDYISTINNSAELQVASTHDLLKALRHNYLYPKRGMWTSFVLDENRRKVRVSRPDGSVKAAALISAKAPLVADLPPVPENGKLLIIWGGSPEALDYDEVRFRLNEIRNTLPIADIVFASSKAVFSMQEGFGEASATRERVEFPNAEYVREVLARREVVAA